MDVADVTQIFDKLAEILDKLAKINEPKGVQTPQGVTPSKDGSTFTQHVWKLSENLSEAEKSRTKQFARIFATEWLKLARFDQGVVIEKPYTPQRSVKEKQKYPEYRYKPPSPTSFWDWIIGGVGAWLGLDQILPEFNTKGFSKIFQTGLKSAGPIMHIIGSALKRLPLVGSILGKGLKALKILKLIPIVGNLFGLALGAIRWKQGDKTGSVLEIISALAGFTGVGEIASYAIDAFLMLRDFTVPEQERKGWNFGFTTMFKEVKQWLWNKMKDSALGKWFAQIDQSFKLFGTDKWEGLKSLGNTLLAPFKSVFNGIEALFGDAPELSPFPNFTTTFNDSLKSIQNDVANKLSEWWYNITDTFKSLKQWGKTKTIKFLLQIPSWDQIVNRVKAIETPMNSLWENIKEQVSQTIDRAKQFLADIKNGISDTVKRFFSNVVQGLSGLSFNIEIAKSDFSFIQSHIDRVKEKLSSFVQNIVSSIKQSIQKTFNYVTDSLSSAKSLITGETKPVKSNLKILPQTIQPVTEKPVEITKPLPVFGDKIFKDMVNTLQQHTVIFVQQLDQLKLNNQLLQKLSINQPQKSLNFQNPSQQGFSQDTTIRQELGNSYLTVL